MRVWPAALGLAGALAAAAPPVRTPPIVSVWYRGQPAGVPVQDDLAALRALGFGAVTWPAGYAEALPELRRLAANVGLDVEMRDASRPVSETTARQPGELVDISASAAATPAMIAVAWRAVSYGARRIAFDAGAAAGAGVDRSGPPWTRAAASFARQLTSNTQLFDLLRDAPPLPIESSAHPHVDVVLRQTDRAWVLIATNTDRVPHRLVTRLPTDVPSALWVSLIDGDGMSMLALPGGPRWTVDLDAGEARAYVIDKVRRTPHTPAADTLR